MPPFPGSPRRRRADAIRPYTWPQALRRGFNRQPAPRAARARRHVAGLLAAYANGSLAPHLARRVRGHLAGCSACRDDLAAWRAVAGAAALAAEPTATPSPALLSRVWAAIDAPADLTLDPSPTGRWTRGEVGRAAAAAAGQLLLAQVRLVPRAIWAVSAAALALGLPAAMVARGDDVPRFVLGVIAPLAAAFGASFLYGPETDPALEIALATPTSPRLVLAGRLALVLAYNLVLALAASALLASARPGGPWTLVPVWIGPMLLLSALGLALSLALGAVGGALSVAALGFLHVAAAVVALGDGRLAGVPPALDALWRTNPAALTLAALLFAAALVYAPRRERLARE